MYCTLIIDNCVKLKAICKANSNYQSPASIYMGFRIIKYLRIDNTRMIFSKARLYYIIVCDAIMLCAYLINIKVVYKTISHSAPVGAVGERPAMSTTMWLQTLVLWHWYLHPPIPSGVAKSLAMHRE